MADAMVDTETGGDDDSGLGDDVMSDDQSASSSVFNFAEEHGRRYHSSSTATYLYPNDEKEMDRLDFQHAMFKKLLHNEKLYRAPIDRPQSVLDLGVGTGIWSIEFADDHPQATVLGVDLSPIQPAMLPPNCTFQISDYEETWDFQRRFDFIHASTPVGCIANLNILLARVFNSLNPGGWFEIQTMCPPTSDDESIPKDSAYRTWVDDFCKGLWRAGRNPYLPQDYEKELTNAHFTDITLDIIKIPQNTWPKSRQRKLLGRCNRDNIEAGIEGFSLRPFLEYQNWTWEELQALLAAVRKDIKDTEIHAYWPL